jgi:phage/plasmid-like protein (TIGR03299 family)
MAHELEMVNGVASMAYTGAKPWHGLGVEVPDNLSPQEILQVANLDWRVEKVPAYAVINNIQTPIGHSALIRDIDNKILDVVTDDWNPVQNHTAFEFFNEFVEAGDMKMETAGSLKDGKIVWGLAKVQEFFELFKGDRIDSYLLFSNFHRYGHSTDVRFTPIRVVCNNTLTLSLNSSVEKMVKISHRKEFDPGNVKQMLGVAKNKLNSYKEMASFLGSKPAKGEDIVEYFKRIFPVSSSSEMEMSKKAGLAVDLLETQPGAEFARGTWWQVFNSVTYLTDHIIGRRADTRLASSWYGSNKVKKTKALELAIEMAEVS